MGGGGAAVGLIVAVVGIVATVGFVLWYKKYGHQNDISKFPELVKQREAAGNDLTGFLKNIGNIMKAPGTPAGPPHDPTPGVMGWIGGADRQAALADPKGSAAQNQARLDEYKKAHPEYTGAAYALAARRYGNVYGFHGFPISRRPVAKSHYARSG